MLPAKRDRRGSREGVRVVGDVLAVPGQRRRRPYLSLSLIRYGRIICDMGRPVSRPAQQALTDAVGPAFLEEPSAEIGAADTGGR